MSIKVYLHYEPSDGPEKTSKLTVPKKWVAEKYVVDVLELFTDSYNKANPEHALNKDEIHLVTESKEKIFSNAIVGEALEDRVDYFIVKGVHVREKQVKSAVTETQLRCKNYGCGKFFTEEENTDTSCKHHVSPPFFHDLVKGWTCCKDRKAYDWDAFQQIEGCALGKHSTVVQNQLFSESPTVAAANAADANAPPAPPPAVLKSIADYNVQNPDAATAAGSALKSIAVRKSTRRSDGTARCQNKGCQKDFVVSENTSTSCVYHAGQAIFHDAAKFWSCCANKKCYDFDEFMLVPGCAVGHHDDGEIDLTVTSS